MKTKVLLYKYEPQMISMIYWPFRLGFKSTYLNIHILKMNVKLVFI